MKQMFYGQKLQFFLIRFIFAVFIFSIFLPITSKEALALTVAPRLELSADPGTVVQSVIKVFNEDKESKTFYLRAENFNAKDETGNPSFNFRKEGLSTWINTPLSITLGPGESLNFPVEINIPSDAEPGGHFAAIFFLTEPPDLSLDPSAFGVSAKLGTLILLRVNGDFVSDANILEFATVDKQKFYTQLPVQFYYRFQNTGADHLKPTGEILISNIFGQTTKIVPANTVDGSVLPKSVRKFFTTWTERTGKNQSPVVDPPKLEPLPYWDAVNYQARNFIMGRYKAELGLAFGSEGLKSDQAEFVFYIIPWQLLTVVIPSIILLLIIFRILLKRYNRYIIRRAQRQLQELQNRRDKGLI